MEYAKLSQRSAVHSRRQVTCGPTYSYASMLVLHLVSSTSKYVYEMGLGKTLQCAAFLNLLATKFHLIVVPLTARRSWKRKLRDWVDLNTCVCHGSAEDRKDMRVIAQTANRTTLANAIHNAARHSTTCQSLDGRGGIDDARPARSGRLHRFHWH